MKKYIVSAALLFAGTALDAQPIADSNAYHMRLAGKALDRFYQQHKVGTTMEVVGIGLTVASSAAIAINGNDDAAYLFSVTGSVMAITGWIVDMCSYKHLHTASLHLMGNGVAIDLNKRGKARKEAPHRTTDD